MKVRDLTCFRDLREDLVRGTVGQQLPLKPIGLRSDHVTDYQPPLLTSIPTVRVL